MACGNTPTGWTSWLLHERMERPAHSIISTVRELPAPSTPFWRGMFSCWGDKLKHQKKSNLSQVDDGITDKEREKKSWRCVCHNRANVKPKMWFFPSLPRLQGCKAAPIYCESDDCGPLEMHKAATGQSACVIYCKTQRKTRFSVYIASWPLFAYY